MTAEPAPALGGLLDRWQDRGIVQTRRTVPARVGRQQPWPAWVEPTVRDAFEAQGVASPWTHQHQAMTLLHQGQHVALATGTASGKSAAYLVPLLSRLHSTRATSGRRGSTALYLSPTKALAGDQLSRIRDLGLPGLSVNTHDGDSPSHERDLNRDFGEFLLTNPDMVHHSLLGNHARWRDFFRKLEFVVVDEAHSYRGVFGAHVSLVLRRLRRVAAHYGAEPVYAVCSATMSQPEGFAGRLTGLSHQAITDDDSPHGAVELALAVPQRNVGQVSAELLAECVERDLRTLTFLRSRRACETTALAAREHLAHDPERAARVAAYRGGFLPEDRRRLEEELRNGTLLGVPTTSALELGIDISGLDAVIVAGFPGTRAAFWQQLGRAGRQGDDALGVFLAREDPLDQYLVNHPEVLLDRPVEEQVFNPSNPHVLGPHLCAAADELPLTAEDTVYFGADLPELADQLSAAGWLRRRPQGWFWDGEQRASSLADLRSSGGHAVALVLEESGQVLGTVAPASAPAQVFPGAIYLHQGLTFRVLDLELEDGVARLTPEVTSCSTQALSATELRITEEHHRRPLGFGTISVGTVEVTTQVTDYVLKDDGGRTMGKYALDLPRQTLSTVAVWWTLPSAALGGLDVDSLPGGVHAAEHASIGLLPLFATCDRWDIGGLSTARHPQTEMLTSFVYDGHAGGAGFAEHGFSVAQAWLDATLEVLDRCPCERGCPACVQSPKCGNGNHPLDKAVAGQLLRLLIRPPASAQLQR